MCLDVNTIAHLLKKIVLRWTVGKKRDVSSQWKKEAESAVVVCEPPWDTPWRQKLHLLFRNNWIKMRNFKNCCGHPGEPGC
jgi:hypothetical protein